MKSYEVRLCGSREEPGRDQKAVSPAWRVSVVTVTLTPAVRSSRHQCCEDVGRKAVCGGRMGSSR